MEKKIPTYKIVVNPDDETTGVYAVSLVDEPAIEVDWIKLSRHIVEFEFQANKDKQMLFGPLLIPNKLIFRRDSDGNEYNILFDEDTIQIIADKYNENKLGDIFNFQHSNKKVEAVLLQNWITGEIDKSKEYGFELPKGTWFGGVKVKDEKFWLEEIKTEKVKGFSVEIKAGTELIEMAIEKPNLDVFGYITKNFDICPGAQMTFANLLSTNPDENTIGMIRSAAVIADRIFQIEKDAINNKMATDEQLNEAIALVDDYKDIISEVDKILGTQNNVSYMDGHIKIINEWTTSKVDKNKINLMEVKTRDGMTLTWEGDAEIGKDIFIILEDGTKTPLADGEYELEDGTKIIAQGGKVAEIMAPEAPEAEEMQDADVLGTIKPMMEELRGMIAELSTRLDKLENVESVKEKDEDDEMEYSKITELEQKIEQLSKIAGAPSITKKSDREIEAEKKEDIILAKIKAFKRK